MATEADVLRYQLEDERQRESAADRNRRHPTTGRAGRRQRRRKRLRSAAQRMPSSNSRKAALAAIGHPGKPAPGPDPGGGGAGRPGPRQSWLYAHPVAPADGLVGQRQVRLGQFINVGTQLIAVRAAAEHLGA